VKPDSKPQVPRTSEGQAEEKSDESGGYQSWPVLTVVSEMSQSESEGKCNRSWPKSHASCQCELRVPAEQEFFE
jgi:hypothetical protein